MTTRAGQLAAVPLLAAVGAVLTGCGPAFGPEARNGVVFYCPGAGNIDFGDSGLREGLGKAGFRGQVATVNWTIAFNPAIDQTLRLNAKWAGKRLAHHIEDYWERFPDGHVSIVGLSAGTGVAVWALEDLDPRYKVDSVILLGSSLHHGYDVRKALERVRGNIYVYYSPDDPILGGPMKIFGTIDGVYFQDGAGAVGLHSPGRPTRVINIAYRPEFRRYGYYGGHTDCTSPGFVRAYLAKHILSERAAHETAGDATVATPPARAPRAARGG